MKYTMTLLFISLYFFGNSQTFEEAKDENNETTFSYVVSFDSTKTKDELYNQFRVNIERAYVKSIAPPEINSESSGKLFAQCRSNKLVYNNGIKKDGGYFTYNLYVVCKDGKAKITITDLIYKKGDMVQMKDGTIFSSEEPDNWSKSFMWNKQSKKEWNKMKDQFRKEINETLIELVRINKGHSSDF